MGEPPAGLPRLRLKKSRLQRLYGGHPWVFSNELQEVPPLTPGTMVAVDGPGGEPFGRGMFNPRTLIAVRLLSRDPEELPEDWLERRIQAALEHRTALYPGEECLRLVFGEADGLPGLVVDRYGDALVVQCLTAGMETFRDRVAAFLRERLSPRVVVFRGDSPSRELEGLPRTSFRVPEAADPLAEVHYLGLHLEVDLLGGQKTGLFLDQRENVRRFLALLSPGARVLDVFAYRGVWGLSALRAGASLATFVEASRPACRAIEEGLSRNGLPPQEIHEGDAFDVLPRLRREGKAFDAVVLDPPAFAKSRKHLPEAEKAYRRLNELGFSLLRPGGLLVTCSCSHHVGREAFREIVAGAAARSRRRAQLLLAGGQAPDHPVLLAFPEGDYLKALFVRVLA